MDQEDNYNKNDVNHQQNPTPSHQPINYFIYVIPFLSLTTDKSPIYKSLFQLYIE